MTFGLTPTEFALTLAVTAFGGFIKGAVGFAMPMLLMSVLPSFLPVPVALAVLIMPTLFTNIAQAGRQGLGPALASTRKYRLHIAMVALFILVSAPFARIVPDAALALALGIPITAFALWQLSGRSLRMNLRHRRLAEAVSGIIGGLYGGISGIWGPPLIVYLLSTDTPKQEQVRVQGVVFLLGAVVLAAAHLRSGVLNAQTLPLSMLMVLPAMAGLWLGFSVQDRLDLAQFRRWTLVLLVLTGLNLVRRALL